MQTGSFYSIDTMKSLLLKGEAVSRTTSGGNPPKKESQPQAMSTMPNCYTCGQGGHSHLECSYAGSGLKRCYECHKMVRHTAEQCRQRAAQQAGNSDGRRGGGVTRGRGYLKKSGKFWNTKNRGGPKRSDSWGNKRQKSDRDNRKSGGGGNRKYHNKGKKNDNRKGGDTKGKGGQMTNKTRSENTKTKSGILATDFSYSVAKPNSRDSDTDYRESNDNVIKFVADTGATEHLVKSHLILTDLVHSGNDFVRSANKHSSADLKLDGHGDLFLV